MGGSCVVVEIFYHRAKLFALSARIRRWRVRGGPVGNGYHSRRPDSDGGIASRSMRHGRGIAPRPFPRANLVEKG
jgi:hypothetical protein